MDLRHNPVTDFFKDISNFLSFKQALGVDIGTASIKMAEIGRLGDNFVLKGYGLLETKEYLVRGNEAIQTSSLKISEVETAELLKTLLHEVKPAGRKVFASLPAFNVFVVPIDLPLMSAVETAKTIPFQAKQFIPLPISEVTLDWTKIEEFDDKKGGKYQRLLLRAVPNDLIKKYKAIFRAAGLQLAAFEVESVALGRVLVKRTDPVTMVIDIGALSTSMAVFENGVLKQVGQTDYGSASLTQVLSRSMSISPLRADELKRRRGLTGTGGEYELSTSLMPFLDVIIQECERVRKLFESAHTNKVERAILVGGGANLPGIENYFAAQIKLKFDRPMATAFLKYPAELEPTLRSLNNDLSVAIGLAMRAYTR